MRVHRFMSRKELTALMSGKKLVNRRDHKKEGLRTTSVGFCFFTEDPDEAVHWLSGIVCLECCVTMEVDDGYLVESYGVYVDISKDDPSKPLDQIPSIKRREYCRSRYSIDDVKILNVTCKYESMYPSVDVCEEMVKFAMNQLTM